VSRRGTPVTMKNVEDLIERNPRKRGGAVVFAGTKVPVALLFEFLEDDQTIETFLDHCPAVSRDQARGVLGAARDLLLAPPDRAKKDRA
jgi:uncharacterized protein (DUF433 family)